MAPKAKDWSKQIEKALAFIADGESVRRSCEKAGIATMTFLDNVDGVQYARARDAQADAHFTGMVDLEEQCLRGEIDPQVYRVVMDTRKWRLARMKPTAYGDRSQLDHTSSDGSMDSTRSLKIEFVSASSASGGGREENEADCCRDER